MKRRIRWFFWCAVGLLLVAGGAAWAGGTPAGKTIYVRLASQARAHGLLVRLSDMGNIRSPEARIRGALENLAIGVAPALCREAVVPARVVRDRIQRAFPGYAVVVNGAKAVRVTRLCRRLSSEELEKVGKAFIKQHMRWNPERVRIRDVKVPAVMLPHGAVSYQVNVVSGANFLGDVVLGIGIRQGNEVVRRVRWQGRVCVYRDVVVATRRLMRNQTLGPSDVRVEKRDLAGLKASPLRSLEYVLGKRVKHRIPAGAVLTGNDLDRPLWVRRGERVTLVARSPYLSVSTVGKAQDNGCEGDRVRVRNLTSRKLVAGRVVAPRTVEVRF